MTVQSQPHAEPAVNPNPDIAPRPKLWLLRHGETEWSRSGQYTGSTDLPLTDRGEQQARDAGERLRALGVHFDLVLSSPRHRALRTAELAGLDTPEVLPEAHEWDYGDYEGLRSADIRRTNPSYVIWDSGVPNGETVEEVGARADRIIERVRRELAGGGNALLVSHGHFSRVVATRWLDLDPHLGRHFLLGTAQVCELGWDKTCPAIERWGV